MTEPGPPRGSAPGLSLPQPRAHRAGSWLVWGQKPAFWVASSAAWQHVCVSHEVMEKNTFFFSSWSFTNVFFIKIVHKAVNQPTSFAN